MTDAEKIAALESELVRAQEEIDQLRAALFWCGGSPSFAPEGEAHEGWVKGVAPLLTSGDLRSLIP